VAMNTPIKVPSRANRSFGPTVAKGKSFSKENMYSDSNSFVAPKLSADKENAIPRVAVFLDGSNFFFMQKDALQWFIDPKKLLAWISQYGDIVDANYYTTVDNRNDGQVMYMRALSHMGFRVEDKQIEDTEDFDGSVDLDMIIDILTHIDNFDMAVILSGDSDFARICEVLRARGKRFLVLSTKGMVSNDIRSVAGMHYRDIAELRKEIEKN